MPNAAIVAAALTDHAVRTFALWVGGVDWLKQPGTSGNLFGVPIDTIEVTENGPGGVSSLRFTCEDPLKQVGMPTAGSEVLFMDIADDHPEFLGYLQTVDVHPHEGQQGRYFDVTAIGIECLLDWNIVDTVTLLAGSSAATVAAVYQQAATGALLNTAYDGGFTWGNQQFPIGATAVGVGAPTLNAVTVTNVTLREALRTLFDQGFGGTIANAPNVFATIDFTRDLRMWANYPAGSGEPADYITLTVNDTAFTNTSSELHYTLTPADVIRRVTVVGTGYTGTFSDGTGIVGQEVVLNDSTITTAAQGQAAAAAYLADFAAQVRGNLHLQTFNHGTTKYQAGSRIVITDVAAGLNGIQFTINSIRKRYNSNGSEEWDVAFGGLAPSGARLMRRLTRSTLS